MSEHWPVAPLASAGQVAGSGGVLHEALGAVTSQAPLAWHNAVVRHSGRGSSPHEHCADCGSSPVPELGCVHALASGGGCAGQAKACPPVPALAPAVPPALDPAPLPAVPPLAPSLTDDPPQAIIWVAARPKSAAAAAEMRGCMGDIIASAVCSFAINVFN